MHYTQPQIAELDKLYLGPPEKVRFTGVEDDLGGLYHHLWRNFDVARFARDWKCGIGRVPAG